MTGVYLGTDGWVHSNCPSQGGFPSLLWDTLQPFGYLEPPVYKGREYVELGIPRCEVELTIPSTPAHPEWEPLQLVVNGYHLEDTWEQAALQALSWFCEEHCEEVANTPAAVLPFMLRFNSRCLARMGNLIEITKNHPSTALAICARCYVALSKLYELQQVAHAKILQRSHIELQSKERKIRELKHEQDAKIKRTQVLREELANKRQLVEHLRTLRRVSLGQSPDPDRHEH